VSLAGSVVGAIGRMHEARTAALLTGILKRLGADQAPLERAIDARRALPPTRAGGRSVRNGPPSQRPMLCSMGGRRPRLAGDGPPG
jgi:hypothetical protein